MCKKTLCNLQNTGIMILFSLLLVLGLAFPASAQDRSPQDQQQQQQQQQQQDPWEQEEQAVPADFDDEEVDRAASAYVDIIDIREDYQERLAEVDDPEVAQQIQMEANEEITEAVEDNGIDVETYNDIITAAQADEELMNDLLNKIDRLQ